MTGVWLFILILSFFAILYTYFIYPMGLIVFSAAKPVRHDIHESEKDFPSLTLIIPALSGLGVIAKKLENALKLYYPKEKLQIIVVSDKENIPVQDLISTYKKFGVLNFKKSHIKNKYEALNIGAKLAKTDVVVFTDEDNEFNDMVLMKLAQHFKDESIGAVSGVRKIFGTRSSQFSFCDNMYWTYECALKKAESKLGSVSTATGEIMAIRKSLYQPIDTDVINFDTAITLNLIESHHRVILEPEAFSLVDASQDLKDSFIDRANMSKGNFQVLFRNLGSLLIPRTGFAFNFFSRKVLRWLVPFFLLAIFIMPLVLIKNSYLWPLIAIQIVFYGFAIFAWFFRAKFKFPKFSNVITYFSVMNAAVLYGFIRFVIRR